MTEQRWSNNDEDYVYASLDDLPADSEGILMAGDTVYVGDLKIPASDSFFNTDQIIEDMQEKAWVIGGEHSCNFLENLADAAKKELSDSIASWLDKYGDVQFGTIVNEKPYVVTKEDVPSQE